MLCVLSASIEPIIVKIGYNNFKNINPIHIIIIKNLIGFSIFLLISLYNYFIKKNFKLLNFKDIIAISKVSVLLLFTTSMMIISLKFIPAVIMLTIFSTTPLFVSFTNSFIKKVENLEIKFFIGFILAFIGVTLTIRLYDFMFSLNTLNNINFIGILIAFLGVLSSTIYRTTLDELTNKFSSFTVSIYIFLINGLVILSIFPFVFKDLGLGSFIVGFYGGVSGSIANVAFLYALSILGSTKVSILNMLNQPTVIFLSALILKEKLYTPQLIGIFLTIIGVLIARKTK